ncbi:MULTISPECIES: hypothetical protein [unclassified Sphingopyxis]|nr:MULTISPECIES: hypothetical protein [unclassified Sphingopyxis]
MSIYISLFHRLGGNHKAQKVEAIDPTYPAISFRKFIKAQANRVGEPRLWNMSSWNGSHHMSNFVEASAVALEYKEGERAAVSAVLNQLGSKCFVIDTVNGFAVIFPLSVPAAAGQYTRLASVLSTIIGCYNLIGGCQAGTFAFYPTDTAKVVEIGSDVIDTPNFIHQTFELDADIGQWFKDKPTKAAMASSQQAKASYQSAITTASVSMSASSPARCASAPAIAISGQPSGRFDDLFEKMDDRVGRLEAQMTNVEMLVSYLGKKGGEAQA